MEYGIRPGTFPRAHVVEVYSADFQMGKEVWDENQFGSSYGARLSEWVQPLRQVGANQFHEWDYGVSAFSYTPRVFLFFK
jgi:hypothetical protein